MASTNFKIFDENKTNIMSDGQYSTNQQRINGVQTGVASSQLNNKFAYQVSLIAYALAQMMVANGLNANDSDAVTTFVNNLSSSILQKVVDKASEEVALAGTDDTKWMSALQVTNVLNVLKPKVEIARITSTQQWQVPEGVTVIDVYVVGGGGGGGYNKGAGGGGGYCRLQRDISVTPGQQIQITIGAGGAGGDWDNINGAAGGATSFGSFVTAYGGNGGRGNNGSGGSGGSGGGGGGSGQNNSFGGNGGTGGESGNNGDSGSGGSGNSSSNVYCPVNPYDLVPYGCGGGGGDSSRGGKGGGRSGMQGSGGNGGSGGNNAPAGGGGGGGAYNGIGSPVAGNGGSGICIIYA